MYVYLVPTVKCSSPKYIPYISMMAVSIYEASRYQMYS
jgi:hypothetical protein